MSTTTTVLTTDVNTLARTFIAVLRNGWLTERQMRSVVTKNRANPECCATHDYCDANMAMDEAFKASFGRPMDLGRDEDKDLWNRAWNVAKAVEFDAMRIKDTPPSPKPTHIERFKSPVGKCEVEVEIDYGIVDGALDDEQGRNGNPTIWIVDKKTRAPMVRLTWSAARSLGLDLVDAADGLEHG